MNEKKAKEVIDAFEKVEKITQSRPPLPKGILPSYVKLIDVIYQLSNEKKVKVSDLSSYMRQTTPSITRSLKAMEELELITKTVSSSDKRVVYISLTKKGMEMYTKYVKTYYASLSKKLSKYKDSDIDAMISLIDDIYENLTSTK